jgi:hypothetical protein
MVSLQWQIQNLNPMQMPRFLGLYTYKVHFSGFTGTIQELQAQRKAEKGDDSMHPGADLQLISEALRQIASDSRVASDSRDEQGRGASALLKLPGVGQAIVSGFLHLRHPGSYGLINSPTKAPFNKDGWLKVTDAQRQLAEQHARKKFDDTDGITGQSFKLVFRWQVFLDEVRQLCGLTDFHEVDQLLWTLAAEPKTDADSRLLQAVKDIRDPDLATRKEAERKARQLIEESLGHLSADQVSELFTLLNTCQGPKTVQYTRFSPAFVGNNANLLIDQLPLLNSWIERLWKAPYEEIPTLLSQFWNENLPGSGRSLPTAILYLRDQTRYAVWTTNLEKALYSVAQGLPAKVRTGFSYLQYCSGVQSLRKKVEFPPEMHDFVLFRLMKQGDAETLPPPDADDEVDPIDDGKGKTKVVTKISDLAASTYLEEGFFETANMYLKDKKQLIFHGPPGTGKTFVAMKYAEYLAQPGGRVQTVQFHPSYGYEDFIEGLRPVPHGQGLSYKVEPGLFKRFCDQARSNPEARYVLLIDEINRGNLPRIFGELLLLLEHRGKSVELPYSKDAFSVPANVLILGTMNSSDRSIALLDLALRRRFHFIEMQPRSEILLGWLQEHKKPKYVKGLLDRLNQALHRAGIEHDRFIGHAFFMSPHLDDEFLKLVWKGTIEPLLKEYFFAEPEKVSEFKLEAFQNVIDEVVAAEDASEESADEEESLNGDAPHE